MNHTSPMRQEGRRELGWLLAFVSIVLVLVLILFQLLMQPTVNDFVIMTGFLLITAIFSVVLGYGVLQARWFPYSPSLRWSMLSTYALSSLLTFLCVWLTARLMFVNAHDLLLGTILLLFAGGIAMALGYFFSQSLMERIDALRMAARQVTAGDLSTRVEVTGQDEMAELAQSFNSMIEQLEVAAAQRRELDALRRDLFAWLGHDLQTPLASIQALVEALADGIVEDAEVKQRYLRTAQRDIQALSGLIDDLFQMSRIDAGGIQLEITSNSLADLVSDTLERFAHQAMEKDVDLVGTVEEGIDPVQMDSQKIGRVLANLVANAIRHTPARGEVSVSVVRLDDAVAVTVGDTGDGIDPDDIPFIFDRFYRGDKSRSRTTGGSGLGLTIARGLVVAHGGEIRVESKVGEGTSFTFILPQ
ncbi:MAG: sensor histidine kinase [Anaerolineales bacterium]